MRRWKKFLLAAFGFCIALIVASCFLPSQRHVVRAIVIRGEAQHVFASIATLKRWPEWTAWTTNRFLNMTMRFEGPDSGVGATMIAVGKSSGDGTVKIIAADLNRGIDYTLDFNHGAQLFAGGIHYTNTPDGLRVTWTLDAALGRNPLKRWAGLAMERLMSGDMEKGLSNLKQTMEARP